MRFLNTTTLKLEEFANDNIPPYAILSHTWEYGKAGTSEVTFADFDEAYATTMAGYEKIINTSRLARGDGFQYVWIDTCCIDRSSSVELAEMINSMYQWFQKAEVCYAYLADVLSKDILVSDIGSAMLNSRWFTRGWTLQELIAPPKVIFLSADWLKLGTKVHLGDTIFKITGIPVNILSGDSPGTATAAQRISWASRRNTRLVEDRAYSLLGIFGINMPIIYGEGDLAFIRLQEEILRVTGDQSLFDWDSTEKNRGVLARSPDAFANTSIPSPQPGPAAKFHSDSLKHPTPGNIEQESTYTESVLSETAETDGIFSRISSRTNSSLTLSSLFSNATVPETIIGQFLAILVSDNVLHPLYAQALRRETRSVRKKFEVKFVVLLERYQIDLLAQIPDVEEMGAIRILQQHKKQFARYISEQFDFDDKDLSAKWTSVISQEPDKLAETERYLANLNTSTNDTREVQVHEQGHKVAEIGNSYPNYERLKRFLVKGPAISHLRDNLRFLVEEEASSRLHIILESDTDEISIAGPSNLLVVQREETLKTSGVENEDIQLRAPCTISTEDDVQSQLGGEALERTRLTSHENNSETRIDPSGNRAQSEDILGPLPDFLSVDLPTIVQDGASYEPSSPLRSEPSERTHLLHSRKSQIRKSHAWKQLNLVFSSMAEFFGYERPLENGKTRVRWKCACGKRFYHDYIDFSGMGNPQDTIPFGDVAADAEEAIHVWGGSVESHAQLNSNSSQYANPELGARQNPQAEDDLQTANHENRDGASTHEHPEESWILLSIPYRGIAKVTHLPAGDQTDDETLFYALKQAYSERSSCWSRFWNLRAVTKVDFGMFQMTTDDLAGKPASGIWPCSRMPEARVKQLWLYEPCPIRKNDNGEPESPVPRSWMLHLWNYPDHTAKFDDPNNQGSSPSQARGFLFRGARSRNSESTVDPETQNAEIEESGTGRGPGNTAVLTATPKKLGQRITVPRHANEFPQCWGLYCEEGFRISWIVFAILFVYLFASLAFAVAWYVEHKAGPQAGLGSFGVASWMVGLLALSITTWFAAVKD